MHCLDYKSGSESGLGSNLSQSKMDNLQPGFKSEKQKRKFQNDKVRHSFLGHLYIGLICLFNCHKDLSVLGILSIEPPVQ